MPFRRSNAVFALLVLAGFSIVVLNEARAEGISYARDIRPLFSEHCFACHGPDDHGRKADLRLDDGSAIENGLVIAGDLENSELWQRVISDDPDSIMPPPHFKKPLDVAQKQLLRSWIESGAPFEDHWAFVVPTRPEVPQVSESTIRNEIDAFIQRRLLDAGLPVSPEADRRTLIRRVTLDLTGLPPTPKEVEAFVSDTNPAAYENLIDSLMSRVSYGQNMARYWLDLARYADTHGLHLDNERTMWPYRDWVVRAFHENVRFDDFTRWQLAGDLLPSPTRDQLIASGFNRCNVTTSEGGSINEEWIYRYAVDRTTTTAEVWMGLTAGCAVCHDHKFDPISSRDYYSMYAFFHSAADPAMDGNRKDTPPILKLPTEADQARTQQLHEQIEATKTEIESQIASLDYVDPASVSPAPQPLHSKSVWFDDGFPKGAQVKSDGAALKIVDAMSGPVFDGKQALQRTATGNAQDYYNQGASPFAISTGSRIFAYVFLDPTNPPEAIMLQFHSDGWRHRAVWGNDSKIPHGELGTATKRRIGELPKVGEWVRLEFEAELVGLSAKDKVTGFAFTQYGGTVTWDYLGMEAIVDPVTDSTLSFTAWVKEHAGNKPEALPRKLAKWINEISPEDWTEQQRSAIRRHWLQQVYANRPQPVRELEAKLSAMQLEVKQIEDRAPYTFVMADLEKPRESFVMLRGAYDKPGEKVKRNVPSFLPALPPSPENREYNRLDLANWLVDGNHPLTARVTVNRFWQQFFGNGLVRTSADFGSQGEPPTHPELLDWLAVQFVDDGWDVKRFVKRILMSHTYRQAAQVSEEALTQDPSNRLLGRAPRLRLDAEVLRDQALYVSGLLVNKVGGKGVNPYQPPNIWEPVGFGGSNTRFYKQGTGDDLYRRSLYTFLKRTAPPPFMSTFDAPNREQSCSRRERTNTPMQALQLMNDVQHFEAARKFAERIVRHADDDARRITWGWCATTSREPSAEEQHVAQRMLSDFRKRFEDDAAAAEELLGYGESSRDESIPPSELASFTMFANLLLNLDETINRN